MKQIKFGKIPEAMAMPDLLEMQTNSFRDFMQLGVEPEDRKLLGLQAAFLDVFPIESTDGSMVLDFVRYEFASPRFASALEAQNHDSSWTRPAEGDPPPLVAPAFRQAEADRRAGSRGL